jgi:hypothetical protein
MRAHGVPRFPDPIGIVHGKPVFAAPVDPHLPHFGSANQACRSLLPTFGGGQITAEDQADYLKAARCMRAHGVLGFPDPVFAGGQVTFPNPSDFNSHTRQFLRAETTCRKLIPPGLPYSR